MGAVQVIALLSAAVIFIIPFRYFRYFIMGYSALRIISALYMLVSLIIAAKRKRADSLLSLLSFSIMIACMLNDLLFAYGLIESRRLLFAGLLIFAAQQTYRLIKDSLAYQKFSEETYRRLNALTSQKESFISRNSIELYKPIRNIVELGESLLRGSIGPLNSEQIATSSLIVSNGTRLSNMINDILDFSSIRDDSLELHRGAVELFQISQKVLGSCESMIAVHEKTLTNSIDRETPPVDADERRGRADPLQYRKQCREAY